MIYNECRGMKTMTNATKSLGCYRKLTERQKEFNPGGVKLNPGV